MTTFVTYGLAEGIPWTRAAERLQEADEAYSQRLSEMVKRDMTVRNCLDCGKRLAVHNRSDFCHPCGRARR